MGLSLVILTAGWAIILPAGWLIMSALVAVSDQGVTLSAAISSMRSHIPDHIAFVFQHQIFGEKGLGPMSWAWYEWSQAKPVAATIYIYSSVLIEALLVSFTVYQMMKLTSGVIHTGGLKRSDDNDESISIARKALRKISKKNRGVRIHPLAGRMSLTSETRHFLYSGMSGAGKTQALKSVLFDAMERCDRIILHDMKGDFSRMFSVQDYKSGRVTMLCPWDKRCRRHHALNFDIRDESDCELVSSTMLPGDLNASAEYWGKAGEDVLSGIFSALMNSMNRKWSWADLGKMFTVAKSGKLAGKPVILMKSMEMYRPGALIHTQAAEQAAGVVGNIRADIKSVDHIARLWPKRRGGFSIRGWVTGRCHKNTKVLIIKGSKSKPWYRAAMATQLSLALSSAMDLPEKDNRVWVFLDELPQLPRITNLKDALLTLRSKGVRVVLGIQDASAMQKIYGEDDTKTILGMCATKVFGQASGEQAKWASQWFSGSETERRQDTTQANQSNSGDAVGALFDPATQSSSSYQRVESAAVPDWCFETLPESRPVSKLAALFGGYGGPTMYVKTPDIESYVLRLKFPYEKLPEKTPHEWPVDEDNVKGDHVHSHSSFKSRLAAWRASAPQPEAPADMPGDVDTDTGGKAEEIERQADDHVSVDFTPDFSSSSDEQDQQLSTQKLQQQAGKDDEMVGESLEEIAEETAQHAAEAIVSVDGAGAALEALDALTTGSGGPVVQAPAVHHTGSDDSDPFADFDKIKRKNKGRR